MTADLRRLVKKNSGAALNTLVGTRGKEITRKS